MSNRPAPIRCGGTEFRWGERTYIMGVLNVTPDSFSGDGLVHDLNAVLERALKMEAAGADIIDIGGESTRPGYEPVSEDEELRRVMPALERLAGRVKVPLSIDTSKSAVAARVLEAGALIVNDVWGLSHDPGLARVSASAGAPLILTANEREIGGGYDIMKQVISSLEESLKLAAAGGVPRENIIIDPGIGFGKSKEENLEIIGRLSELKALGRPVLLGTSRKLGGRTPEEKLAVSAATVALGIANGADIVRVHDVKETARVARMCDAITRRNRG